MKKRMYVVLALAVLLGVTPVKAQAPYKHSIGVLFGTNNGFSYKGFFGRNFAFQTDVGYNVWIGGADGSFVVNPLLMYEAKIKSGLHGFVGGGAMIGGANWGGRFGVHAVGGLEYVFGIPLTLQFDLRPGFGLGFWDHGHTAGFDIGICFSIRYVL